MFSVLASLAYNFGAAAAPLPAAVSTPALFAATGDGDVPRRVGDSGDRDLPGATAVPVR